MRITTSMMSNRMLSNLNKNMNRLATYEQMWASGKKFSVPSDNPIAVAKSLELNTKLSELKQFKKNSEDALSWMEITETAVGEVVSILQRVRELAVDADGVETAEDKAKIKAELDQLKEQLISVSNTTYGGKYIFSGYKTDKPLLGKNGEYKISFDDGNQEIIEYQTGVANNVDVNVLGYKLFGVIDKSSAQYLDDLDIVKTEENVTAGTHHSQLIAVLDELGQALDEDNQDKISAALGRIDKHMENVLSIKAEIGGKYNGLELTINRIEMDNVNFTSLLSKNEDADIAEVMMEFTNAANVYQASLYVSAKIIQPSLMDFLR